MGVGGGGVNLYFVFRKTILSHFNFSLRFPTFLEKTNFFGGRGGGFGVKKNGSVSF